MRKAFVAAVILTFSMTAGAATVGFSSGGYTIEQIGLVDAEHTRDTDGSHFSDSREFNEAGQAAGFSERYGAGGTDLGDSVWVHNGSSTVNVGLIGSEYTRDTDGYRRSTLRRLNEAGQVMGYAHRYAAGGTFLGRSVWVYNGNSTINVGLTGAEHTRDTDGYRYSSLTKLNQAGQAAGSALRYGAGGTELGKSAWVYNGSGTVNVGLTDSEHTRDPDGFRHSDVNQFNEAGQAAGFAERYGVGGSYLGRSAWVYNGSGTVNVGLTGAEHTRDTDGYRSSFLSHFNEAGQAAGNADRFGAGGTYLGKSAWFYDGDISVSLDGLSENSSGYAYSEVDFLSDDGLVLGTYRLFDEFDNYRNAVFGYSEETGLFDLELAVDESFDDWSYLRDAFSISDGGVIFGDGRLDDPAFSHMSYKLTAVPVPAAVWLFGSALAGLGWMRRKQTV